MIVRAFESNSKVDKSVHGLNWRESETAGMRAGVV